MVSKATFVFCLVFTISYVLAMPYPGGGGGGGHHKVTIHVPIHEKEIKHTHTKYVTVYHDSGKDEHDLSHPELSHGGWH